jgi:hypothetical protein
MEIELTNGGVALCDERDYDELSVHSWFHVVDRNVTYAARSIGFNRILRMHTQIMLSNGSDHIDGNGLDNRRSNLRNATNSQNQMNRGKHAPATSKFKGVGWHGRDKRWIARIKANGKRIQLGSFKDEASAAEAYDKAAFLYFGEYARLNNYE